MIFTSDNGPWLSYGDHAGSSGPHREGKGTAWEGGTRLPFIVAWPGTVKPGLSDALLSHVDLLASLAALTGAKVPDGAARDSQNLLDALLGRSMTGRDNVVQQGVGIEAIRQGWPLAWLSQG